MTAIRKPAVAGLFYSGHARELAETVATMLDKAKGTKSPPPKALIVPHAGYIYSGPVAAEGYALLLPWRSRYRRVVLLGPAHRVWFKGLAVSGAAAFRTPIGDVTVDTAAIAALDVACLQISDDPHDGEHSLEVHLPFLQSVLDEFTLVPIVVGDASAEDVEAVIDALWGGPETLIVVSSDLSHYLPYDKAVVIDARTSKAIEELDGTRINHSMACGATPLTGLLLAARRRGLTATTVDLRNSGDTAGGRGEVVGYGAWAIN